MRQDQVWNWKKFQRRTDSLMNKAYIFSCRRLVERAQELNPTPKEILDIGAGSGLVLRHISSIYKSSFSYKGIDLSKAGLSMLNQRAERLKIGNQVSFQCLDISETDNNLIQCYDLIFSNFCFYTIKDNQKRALALRNLYSYLKDDGTFHVALPSKGYSASGIAIQCFKDELSDASQNFLMKILRAFILVPYQWYFVLKPIEKKINEGFFLRFSKEQIEKEFSQANLTIKSISLDYGGCGYHIHGKK
jgi:SAM-dependent methyltransferase